MPVCEIFEHLVGNITDPQLKGGAVFNQGSDMMTNLADDVVVAAGGFQLGKFRLEPDHRIDVPYMDEPVTVRSRHSRVDLSNHVPRGIDGGACDVYRGTQ